MGLGLGLGLGSMWEWEWECERKIAAREENLKFFGIFWQFFGRRATAAFLLPALGPVKKKVYGFMKMGGMDGLWRDYFSFSLSFFSLKGKLSITLARF